MRIAVVGAGAVGGYFGGRLAEAGEEVIFLARGETLETLKRRGLRVDSQLGSFTLPEVRVAGDAADVGTVDAVIVGVKAWQVLGVARMIRPLMGRETCVLPLQNGVDAPRQLAEVLGEKHVLGGVCKILCRLEAPAHVAHLGARPWLALGEIDRHKSERVERLRQALERAMVAAEVPDDIHVAMWEKFLFITAVSGLGALTRMPIGTLLEISETREFLEQAMREVVGVAKVNGVVLPAGIVERTMQFLESLPPTSTASMQRDIMDGRPSELDYQNGAVVRLAREAGFPTPLNHFLYFCLLPMESEVRRASSKS